MTKEQENELNQHFNTINEAGDQSPASSRALIFLALDNIERIESELNKKDRTSKKEVRIMIKDARRQLFEALKGIKGE